jgi:hypothetical protein
MSQQDQRAFEEVARLARRLPRLDKVRLALQLGFRSLAGTALSV